MEPETERTPDIICDLRGKGETMHWYLKVLKNFSDFYSRARRTEYWVFTGISLLITLALGLTDTVMGLDPSSFLTLSGFYGLFVLIPSLAVTVRRLHDIGRTGWWVLICLVPCLGLIVLLVFMCTDSQPGRNMYGENPKGVTY